MPGGSNTAPGAVASVSAGDQGLVRCARYAATMWIYCTIGGYVRTLSRRARGGGCFRARCGIEGDAVEGDVGENNTAPGAVASVSAGDQGLVRCARYATINWIYWRLTYVHAPSAVGRGHTEMPIQYDLSLTTRRPINLPQRSGSLWSRVLSGVYEQKAPAGGRGSRAGGHQSTL